ncbi:putative manganese-dependent inorganic diphosphatase [Pelagicoccus sp. NFK12]|uniref:inorganic diphosphatase n=1 Tax=Pelagicoccus enzymogenes TaxID=2773457 RepID=A0A927IFW9_9BACT|nr:putative manganese-dependent inorganic diphosphatase [Pelagicoccus enzymogenes]MBD5780552.1 putative manganese-dependent inorganic diphosphatase [Pelagicoccus enzymogenes]MDQ8199047.1 putative manganese-dependent inorganic diphosphatase [Pelagicoccus enzymogenes]
MPRSPKQEITYVIGHKNPDADAICSAIAYANFKILTGQKGYIPARCGNTNARIDTILAKFNQPTPLLIADVSPRVRDMMISNVVKVHEDATMSEALQLVDEHDVRVLPVVDDDNILKGYLSIFQMGDYFIPKFSEPRSMRHVYTSINDVARALQADVKNLRDEDKLEDMYVKIGAMDIRSFGKFNGSDAIRADQSIIIVGDRWDIQQRSIQIGVRLLVITGGLGVDSEVLEQAKANGVSLIISPYDSATTAWAIRTASKIKNMIETKYTTFSSTDRLSRVARRIASSNAQAFFVTEDNGQLAGIFTKTDVLKPSATNLVLVDHNEMTQAVPGAAEVNIKEVIDHHRLGSMNTQQPILFLNEPVGSTCTIVADLFRRHQIEPTPEMAGIMMSGIITDTLNLKGPTATEKDADIVEWLEKIAELKADDLAQEVFSSGSVILSMKPEQVIVADQKFYDENGVRFSVSQIEELGFQNFWQKSEELSEALRKFSKKEEVSFACMLVTDINRHNSLLLVAGDKEFIERISYPAVEKGLIYDLQGVVSRKKQLIPFISSTLKGVPIASSSN